MLTHRRVLIIGGSVLQVPAIERARTLGLRVGVVDRDPSSPGRSLAHEFYEVSTMDVEGVLRAAQDFRADGVLTVATDGPMRAVAHVAKAMGLRGPSESSVFAATDKAAMYEVFCNNGVRTPRSLLIDGVLRHEEYIADFTLPLVVKPTDSSGSRGISLISEVSQLCEAVEFARQYSLSGRVIVQEYIEGTEVSVEGICLPEGPRIVAVTDKVTTGSPHFVEMGHTQPSSLSEVERHEVFLSVENAVRSLGISECGFHAELIVSDGLAYVIEIGARLGGDFITSHLVPLTTGVNLNQAVIEIALGISPNIQHSIERFASVSFLDYPGDEQKMKIVSTMPGVVSVGLSRSDNFHGIQNSSDRHGFLITVGDSHQELESRTHKALTVLAHI